MALKLIFILLLSLVSAKTFAQDIERNFKAKNYQAVVKEYEGRRKAKFTKRQYIMISYSLRKLGRYREDIAHNARFVRRFYPKEHHRLIRDVRQTNTIDPEEYPNSLKLIYWIILSDYEKILTSYQEKSPALDRDYQHFQIFSKLLEGLEFREGQVDRINTRALNHFAWLENRIYHFTGSMFLNYVSWQREILLIGTGKEIALQVTNRGYCAGGEMGFENYKWHFYVDGCFLFGAGGVTNTQQPPEYQQSDVRAMGFKAGPGASLIVSSSKSRVGIKLPVIFTIQRFQNPPVASNLEIEETNPFSFMGTLYSRFQFDKWYLQTEVGKYMKTDDLYWGIGVGKQF